MLQIAILYSFLLVNKKNSKNKKQEMKTLVSVSLKSALRKKPKISKLGADRVKTSE